MTATRPAYSCEEFAAEILDGKRAAKWVRKQCRLKKIVTVGKRPWLIPNSEAQRFISPTATR
jgi:hypothetical protein